MRILHFADLHLDAPFAWADSRVAGIRRRNRRRTLERIAELVGELHADVLTSGGDLFEHDRVGPDTIAFLRNTLGGVGCPVYLAPGNHDWFGPPSPYARRDWPANVHVFTEDRLTAAALADGITLWGAAHRAPANTGDFFAGFRPDRGGIHLAVAHASENGGLTFEGPGKRPHAPFDAAELEQAGIAFALLGHFHQPRVAGHHLYPGNPDPLEFGETGDRGAVLVTIGADGTVELDTKRVAASAVHDVLIRLDGAEHREEVAARVGAVVADLKGSVRVTLSGEVAPTLQLDLAELARCGEHLDGLVVRVRGLTERSDLDALALEPTVRGQFIRDARAIADPDIRQRVMRTGLRALDGRDDLEVG
ncbi:MAG: metallophosphoesterase [Candidatus Limnocylindria bacterium]|nr:metallophosphoesterase [Candidatus Limnocylindria bacterium]